MWAHTTTVWVNSPVKKYCKTTFKSSCLSGVLPIKQYISPLCGHTQPLCALLENNFKTPMFTRSAPFPPHKTNNRCVSSRNHCVAQSPLKNYLKTTLRPPCLPAPPPSPHNTNNHCVSRRNHCVGQSPCKKLLENNFQGPHVYQGFPLYIFSRPL